MAVDAEAACVAAGGVVPVAAGFALSQRIVILIGEDCAVFLAGPIQVGVGRGWGVARLYGAYRPQ